MNGNYTPNRYPLNNTTETISIVDDFFQGIDGESEEALFSISEGLAFSDEEITISIESKTVTEKLILLKTLHGLYQEKDNILEGSGDDDAHDNVDRFMEKISAICSKDTHYIVSIAAEYLRQNHNTAKESPTAQTYEDDPLYKISANALASKNHKFDRSFYGDSHQGLAGNIENIFLFPSARELTESLEKRKELDASRKNINIGLKELQGTLEAKLNNNTITEEEVHNRIAQYMDTINLPPHLILVPYSIDLSAYHTGNVYNAYEHIPSGQKKSLTISPLYVSEDRDSLDNDLDIEAEKMDFREMTNKGLALGVDITYSNLLHEIQGTGLIHILGEKLGIDFKSIDILYQLHLVKFLSLSGAEDINSFKQALKGITNEEDKYNFLHTFLACSQSDDIGNIIIKLAEKPWSEQFFKAYKELLELEGETGLQGSIQILLSRGEHILRQAYSDENLNNQVNQDLLINYGTTLTKACLFARKLLKTSPSKRLTIQEFNDADIGLNVSTYEGKDLISTQELLGAMLPANYPDSSQFSQDDFTHISDRIRTSLEDRSDPELSTEILTSLIQDLQNPKAHFIFLRNDEAQLMGVCKIIQNNEGSFYYGSHYLHPDIIGDFSLGTALQTMLENETSNGAPLNATVKLDNEDAILRHIEYAGGVATGISKISNSNFLDFTLHPKEAFQSKDTDLSSKEDFTGLGDTVIITDYACPLKETHKQLFKQGYALSRIIKDRDTRFMVFERLEMIGDMENCLKAA